MVAGVLSQRVPALHSLRTLQGLSSLATACCPRQHASQARRLQTSTKCAAVSPLDYSQGNGSYNSGPQAPRLFSDFSVYKGKAAITFKIISPQFSPANEKGQSTVKRQGVVLLEFANVLEGSGTAPGERRYDWQNKQNFALSPTEFAGIVEPSEQKFAHDPGQNSPTGQVFKQLTYQPAPNKQDYFIGLQVRENNADVGKFSVVLARNEITMLRIAANTIIPHLLGLDMSLQQLQLGTLSTSPNDAPLVPNF